MLTNFWINFRRSKVNEIDWAHDRALQKVIDIMELPCPWCETQIRVDSLKSHFVADCTKFPLQCIFEGCNDEVSTLPSHSLSDTRFRVIK
jgi:hypothetical protein